MNIPSFGDIANLISSTRSLMDSFTMSQIGRIEDLPYVSSPPLQFIYESEALLNLGQYVWNETPKPLITTRLLQPNVFYYFRNISLSADISELDFTGSIVTSPVLQFASASDAYAPLFRDAVTMNMFYSQFDYRFLWLSTKGDNTLRASFNGHIVQTPALIGKTSITLKAVLSAQEITDADFVKLLRKKYPSVGDK